MEEEKIREQLPIVGIGASAGGTNSFEKLHEAPPDTIMRRTDQRMSINHITSHRDYLNLLRENTFEKDTLNQNLRNNGNAFYGDPEIFEKLSTTVFPQLLANKKLNKPIRIWVSSCSTGEEAYSLAIAFFDILGGLTAGQSTHHKEIQIFATDISESAISKARSGIYTAAELEGLSLRNRETYFTKIGGSYKVVKSVRDSIVFAVHSFIKDPPFSNVDLVSCRNVLTYLDPILQEKVLVTLHYGLNENGFLLLGKSETTDSLSNLFITFSKQDGLFIRRPGSGRFVRTLNQHREENKVIPINKIPMENHSKMGFKENAEAILISKYTPSSVVVDEHMEVVHVNGNIDPFLAPSSGKPTHELLKMARKELVFELRNAIHKAKTIQESVTKEGIQVLFNGVRFSASIEVVPLPNTLEPHYLILFRKKLPSTSFGNRLLKIWKSNFKSSEKDHLNKRNTSLENELEQIREDMRHISQDQEAFNEESQSANEELSSSNEEMQSLNEELETSKEELQSTNEELININRELLEKQGEVNFTLNYLEAIIANLREPLLVLEKDFRVQIANASFYKNFKVVKTEIEGMPFFKMQDEFWDNDGLRTLLLKVLPEKKRVVDEEIVFALPSGEKRSFMLNAREIVREKDSEKLILLSMEDITERKKTESYKKLIAQLEQTNEQLDKYVHVASHDLQEPLRKIMIFSDLLLNNQDDDLFKYRVTLEKIANSAIRMSGLIKSLLDYSRVAHHGDLYEWTDLNLILKDIILDFEVLIKEKQAQITINELPEIEAIPLQMTQLLTNLMANALKFSTKEVAPIITVSSRPLSKKDIEKYPNLKQDLDYFEITISDNGIGISPQYHQQVFEIFQRLQNSKDYDGSGIGLSLVKKIVQNHHGTVFMVSEEREGAAFHIILPKTQPK
ncbi:CheR family methyltransferase [Gelidibacter sp.]|uniref:CheR family methyltransferase n=1 Tax=Gelidibacter sp. TaxID=2018083 RepID=UPI002D0CBE2D|nr:CheR family methyltransferase [Gelidibacter sp.]HUH27522.1 CheR family methyltransferase [Gelidibacter sp.]